MKGIISYFDTSDSDWWLKCLITVFLKEITIFRVHYNADDHCDNWLIIIIIVNDLNIYKHWASRWAKLFDWYQSNETITIITITNFVNPLWLIITTHQQ